MPNVGLLEAGNPLPEDAQVSIRYVVEVDGLPVYTELYDMRKLKDECARDRQAAVDAWIKRLDSPVKALEKPRFSSEVTGYLHSSGDAEP